MALSVSVDTIDETGREILEYGTPDFPIAFFDDDLSRIPISCHWHEELEIVVITSGISLIKIAGREFTLNAGEGYFCNSGVLHTQSLKTPSGHQHCMVFSPNLIASPKNLIWKNYIAPVYRNNDLPFLSLSPSVPWQNEFLRRAETAWQSGAYETKDFPLEVRKQLSYALACIANHIDDFEPETSYTPSFQRDEFRIKKALVYISQNYENDISINDIAAAASISTSTCLRLFHSVLSTTPAAYLLDLRLQKASEALKQMPEKPVSDIAYACGFSDAGYFTRCFRRCYEMTPTAFRQSTITETAQNQ